MDLVLRAIERHEVAAAVALIVEGTMTPGAEDAQRLDDYWDAVLDVRRNNGELLVALDEGVVVGMCQIVIFRHFQHTAGFCAELESVFVRSDVRGRGVGAAMLEWAEAFAAQRGCYRVQLTSRNMRVDAHRFYLTHGYDQTSLGFKKPLAQ